VGQFEFYQSGNILPIMYNTPMNTKKKNRPRDLNLLAQSIIEDATPEDRRSSPEEGDHMITPKNPMP
jgi:hypothetical protein